MSVVRVTVHQLTAAVSFEYDAIVVSVIKTLPAHARQWDPARKVWTVAVRCVDDLVGHLRARGYSVETVTARRSSAPPPWLANRAGERR